MDSAIRTGSTGEMKITDEQLIKEFQEGSQEAFDLLVERYRGPLYGFIHRIINDAYFAEDLLQETFLRLWIHKDSYRSIARFSTWIYTIAGNLAKTELRKRKIRRWLPLGGTLKEGDRSEQDHRPIEVQDPVADPDRDFERREIQRRVDEEITQLPLVFREAVILRDIQELSYEEISIILKIPLGTVKSRVNRGRLRLQEKLQDLR